MTGDGPFLAVAVPLVVWLLMVAVGLELALDDFRRIWRQPRVVLTATLGQLLLLPMIGGLLIQLFSPEPWVAAGMILLAASPGGAISNAYAYLAGANLALSVSLTGLSILLGLVSMPLLAAAGFSLFLDRQAALEVPVGRMIVQLAWLLLPLSLGMLLRHRYAELVRRARPALRAASLAALLTLLGAVLLDQWARFVAGLRDLVPLALPFSLLAMAGGWLVGWLLGLDPRDRFTLLIEHGVRNVALVALVGVGVLGRPDMVLFAAVFLVLEAPIVLLLIWARGRRAQQGR